jgi:rhamnosyl/mannosyltransferase
LEVASCSISLTAIPYFKRLVGWADVVHYHYPWPFADLLHFAARVRKPTVLTYHSDIVRQRVLRTLYAPLMKRFLGSMDRLICTSPNYFATSDVLTRFEDKVSVVPIGLSESSYPPVSETMLATMRQRYGEDFFLFVGVLRYYKGLHILLDAIKGAPFRVVIVGSGPTESELKAQAADLQLDNVVFTGQLSDEEKVALFKLSRAVVFPSYLRAEAFGVTLLEGAMYGRALISTEVGSGTSHVNIHGETGLVVPPGSATELRQAMDQLHYRPEMAELMGRRARKRYEQLFTGKLMGQRYLDVYRALTTNKADEATVLAASGGD